MPEHPLSLALLCNTKGDIQKVLHNTLDLSTMPEDTAFPLIVERSELPKALNFLKEINSHQIAYDWEINVPLNSEAVTLHFTGGSTGKQILIVGSQSKSQTTQIYQGRKDIDVTTHLVPVTWCKMSPPFPE